MNRPARKLKHLAEKIALKTTRNEKRVGKKLKQWKKNQEHFKPLGE